MLGSIRRIRNAIAVLVVVVAAGIWLSHGIEYQKHEVAYGITYSPKEARDLGLDWQQAYTAALEELGVKKVRLSAYWDEIEREEDSYDWSELDWLLAESAKRDAKVILAVGGRLPRWPECHFPDWAEKLETDERQAATLDYIAQVVKRYRDNSTIAAWQVENEPFLSQFGECPELDSTFLDQEIALVKAMDGRPVVVTDSGELSVWVPAAKRADIFGTTMYRDTYSKALERYIHYPITPTFFKAKRNLAGLFAEPKDWIVIELQAEPWSKEAFQKVSQEERDRTMSPEKFRDMMEFARATGFREFYLWGVEWWYWEKTRHGRPVFWQEAGLLFSNQLTAAN